MRPGHPLISQVAVAAMAPAEALALDPWEPPADIVEALRSWCCTGRTSTHKQARLSR
jgi:hypothetical protein